MQLPAVLISQASSTCNILMFYHKLLSNDDAKTVEQVVISVDNMLMVMVMKADSVVVESGSRSGKRTCLEI